MEIVQSDLHKNKSREFDERSTHFLYVDHFISYLTFHLCDVWRLLGEKWCWSLLGLEGMGFSFYGNSLEIVLLSNFFWNLA